jgi:penicillin-binding protein 1A
VWMGRDDNSPMRGITGGSAPAEFWKSFMRVALKRGAVTAIPPGPPAPVPVAPVVPAVPPPATTNAVSPTT